MASPDGFRPLFDGQHCTLGFVVADWIEHYCCHGPGDVAGDPVQLDDEWLRFIRDAYALDPATGRRLVDTAVLSRPKGRSKSELAGLLAVAEAFGPVRFDGWDANGQPVGRPVRSPLIKCLATEESQAGNTFENVAFIVADHGRDTHPEVFGGATGVRQYQSARAIYLPHGGEIRAATAGAASKDGGRETYVVADEVHLYVTRELKTMYATVKRNLGKRKASEPWLLQTTTMYRAGEGSVAEEVLTAHRRKALPAGTLVDHVQAKGRIDLDAKDHTLAQLRQVYGPAAEWLDLERIYREMRDPTACPDVATAARYFLNREVVHADAFLPADVVERQARAEVVDDGEPIAVGFDGSLSDDSTVLIGCRMSDGFLFPLGMWERADGPDGYAWEVPRADVDAVVEEVFARYDVSRMYCDPHEWRTDIGRWAESHPDRVLEWRTDRHVQMDAALDRLRTDLLAGSLHHCGDARMTAHLLNAVVARRGRLRLVRKPSQSRKIDAVVGAALALEARADAMAAGWVPASQRRRRRAAGI